MKKSAAVLAGLGLILIGAALVLSDMKSPAFSPYPAPAPVPTPAPVVAEGSIAGSVSLGPTCPVERIPPDPRCALRPYAHAEFSFFDARGGAAVATATTDASGIFAASLPPGRYVIRAARTPIYPRCPDTMAEALAGASTTVSISCDTGIR